jgi:hypothetical protein
MLASHRGGPGSSTGSMWGLWWTKRHWGRFSPSTSVSPANHFTDFSIIIITRGWHNRPLVAAVSSRPWFHPPICKLKITLNSWKILPQTAMQTINNGGLWAYLFVRGRGGGGGASMNVCVSVNECVSVNMSMKDIVWSVWVRKCEWASKWI